MSIDTGQSLSYNQNFPTPNIDNPSQQFRDNFSIIKTAIESLQTAQSDANSIITLSSSVGSAGNIIIDATLSNNSFSLPIGSPTSNATAGMIKYDSGTSTVQFYNGTNWLAIKNSDANGVIAFTSLSLTGLTLNFTPSNGTDGVNVSYVSQQVSTINNAIAFQFSQVNSNASTITANLNAEASTRANSVSSLQTQINNISTAYSNSNTIVGTFSSQISSLSNSISNEANARAAADTTLTNGQTTLNAQVNNAITLANQVQANVTTEASTRATNDQTLYNVINTVVSAQASNNATFSTTFTSQSNSITAINNAITTINANVASVLAQEQSDLSNTLAIIGGITAPNTRERVGVLYSGGTGSPPLAVISNTSGVSATIVNTNTVNFTFTGRANPPVSINILGQTTSTNTFKYTAPTTVSIPGGGVANAPTLFGSFSQLSLNMSQANAGVVADTGNAIAYVWFGF